jgi:hypothetical protein
MQSDDGDEISSRMPLKLLSIVKETANTVAMVVRSQYRATAKSDATT